MHACSEADAGVRVVRHSIVSTPHSTSGLEAKKDRILTLENTNTVRVIRTAQMGGNTVPYEQAG